jgi:hypothetical protein
VPLLFAVVAILVVGAAFLYAAGRWSGLPPAGPDRRPRATPDDFDVVLRGYRMDEVDARIADLQRQITELRPGAGRAKPEA